MTLTIYWLNPAIHAACGYKALYRRKGASSYTELLTSGSTSGSTSLTITASAPASYEGYIQSDCCDENLSAGDPFGVNAYSTFRITTIAVAISPLRYTATITSLYPNPYDTILTGSFVSSLAGTVAFTGLFPANTTTTTIVLTAVAPINAVETFSNIQVSAIDPVFNNGGQLQQNDPVSTPSYFHLYTSGTTSGVTTWNGDPMVLPSFTLDSFEVTETDVDSNPISGNLTMSWAHPYKYADGVFPYDEYSFNLTQNNDSDTVGGVSYIPVTNGLNVLVSSMIKTTAPITTTTPYKMRVYDSAGTLLDSRIFYLPDF